MGRLPFLFLFAAACATGRVDSSVYVLAGDSAEIRIRGTTATLTNQGPGSVEIVPVPDRSASLKKRTLAPGDRWTLRLGGRQVLRAHNRSTQTARLTFALEGPAGASVHVISNR
jgi:hypothetical protein